MGAGFITQHLLGHTDKQWNHETWKQVHRPRSYLSSEMDWVKKKKEDWGIERKLPTRHTGLGPVLPFSFASARPICQSKRRLHKIWQQSIQIDYADTCIVLSWSARSPVGLLPCCKLKELDPSKGYKWKLLLQCTMHQWQHCDVMIHVMNHANVSK